MWRPYAGGRVTIQWGNVKNRWRCWKQPYFWRNIRGEVQAIGVQWVRVP